MEVQRASTKTNDSKIFAPYLNTGCNKHCSFRGSDIAVNEFQAKASHFLHQSSEPASLLLQDNLDPELIPFDVSHLNIFLKISTEPNKYKLRLEKLH
jgi:hypothetical protein